MKQILIESQYIGSCRYWGLLLNADKIYLDQHEHFVKRSYRNRAHLLGANGLLRLSVPLERGKHQHSAMKDVRISYHEQWQKLHWQSFTSAYRRSPFFEFYEEQFRDFYEAKFEFLFDYNFRWMQVIASILKVDLPVTFTEQYLSSPGPDVEDKRNVLLPVKKPELTMQPYTQVFNDRFDFVEDLCVLDLLFNLGTRSKNYLLNIRS